MAKKKWTAAERAAFARRMKAARAAKKRKPGRKPARKNSSAYVTAKTAGSRFSRKKRKRTMVKSPTRRKRDMKVRGSAVRLLHHNPPMRKLGKNGTGWISARRVKIVKRRGRPAQILIEKPRRRS